VLENKSDKKKDFVPITKDSASKIMHGYCHSLQEIQIFEPKINTIDECAEACNKNYDLNGQNFVALEYFKGKCFCQQSCDCWESHFESVSYLMVPQPQHCNCTPRYQTCVEYDSECCEDLICVDPRKLGTSVCLQENVDCAASGYTCSAYNPCCGKNDVCHKGICTDKNTLSTSIVEVDYMCIITSGNL